MRLYHTIGLISSMLGCGSRIEIRSEPACQTLAVPTKCAPTPECAPAPIYQHTLCTSRWCPLELFPLLPRVELADEDQALNLEAGRRFILPVNPADKMRTLRLPNMAIEVPTVIELIAPGLLPDPDGVKVRYRIEREGGTLGHAVALFGASADMWPCVAAQFEFDPDSGGWVLGMNSGQISPSEGVIPAQDAR